MTSIKVANLISRHRRIEPSHPGESLTVTVDVSPATPSKEFLVGSPLGYSAVLKAPPYRFTIQVKSGTTPDNYTLTAVGFAPPGRAITSDPITVLVERADMPVRLRVSPDYPLELNVDEKGSGIEVTGQFADGTQTDLTQSSRVKYVSSVLAVVTVDAEGRATPVAPGSAAITVTYGEAKAEIPVTVMGNR